MRMADNSKLVGYISWDITFTPPLLSKTRILKIDYLVINLNDKNYFHVIDILRKDVIQDFFEDSILSWIIHFIVGEGVSTLFLMHCKCVGFQCGSRAHQNLLPTAGCKARQATLISRNHPFATESCQSPTYEISSSTVVL